MFRLKSSSRFPPRRRPARSLSGFIEDNCTARSAPTAVKSKAVLLSPQRSWMDGPRHDRRISRLDSWNVGRLTAKERAVSLFKAHKFALGQTAHGCAPELPCRTPRRFLAPIDAVAKHLRYYFCPPKKMDLKSMSLFLRASFCVDAPNVRFRIGVGTSSHKKELTRAYLNNARNQ
jgi:hypothetical protein